MSDGRAVFELVGDPASFGRSIDQALVALARLKTGVRDLDAGGSRVAEQTERGLARLGQGAVTVRERVRLASFTLRQMGTGLVSELNPALGQTVSAMGLGIGAARGMGLAVGGVIAAAAVGVSVLTQFARTINDSASRMATLTLAARSFDLSAIQSGMAAASKELEERLIKSRSLIGTVMNAWSAMWEVLGLAVAPTEELARAQAKLGDVLPIERARLLNQQFLQTAQYLQKVVALEQARAAEFGDLTTFVQGHDKLVRLYADELDSLVKLLEVQKKIDLAAAAARGAPETELDLIRKRFEAERTKTTQAMFVRFDALDETRRKGILAIEAKNISPGLGVGAPAGEFLGVPSEEEFAAATAAASRATLELEQRLVAVGREAAVMGTSVDRSALSMDATAAAIRALIAEGVDPADPKLVKLRERFEDLKTVNDLKDVFRDVFGDLNSGINSFVQTTIAGTTTIGQALNNLGNTVASGFLTAVIKKGLEPAQRAILEFVEGLARAGLGNVFAGFGGFGGSPGLTSTQVGAGGGAEMISAVPMQHGGIVTRPTFAMLGERGREAIIPLEHGGGGGRGEGPLVEVRIVNQMPSAQVEQRTSQGPDGRAIQEFIITAVETGVGTGRLDRTLASNFGITRRGVKR